MKLLTFFLAVLISWYRANQSKSIPRFSKKQINPNVKRMEAIWHGSPAFPDRPYQSLSHGHITSFLPYESPNQVSRWPEEETV